MRTLAIIPARGGSKGLPRKNIYPLLGKPLIAWTIEQVQGVPEIDRLICSTEDEEIASVAQEYGCEVPFIRPMELAGDDVSGLAVILHAIDFLKKQGECYDTVINLQCTSPLRTAGDISDALKIYYQNPSAKNLISVCLAEFSPYWMFTKDSLGRLVPLLDSKYSTTRRQDLPAVYRPNGAIYIGDIQNFLITKSFKEPAPFPYIMRPENSIDIDDDRDLQLAEYFLKQAGRD